MLRFGLRTMSSLLPDYLWGIETDRRDRIQEHVDSLLPDYLWGIETPAVRLWYLVFPLPDYLWGIETFPRSRAIRSVSGSFQTTYEELKPTPAVRHSGNRALPDYLWGIETLTEWRWKDMMKASRLPMRNWNSGDLPLSGPVELPDYLWGIETRTFHIQNHKIPLPDYLWGIETSVRCYMVCYYLSASRLPMRNWNNAILDAAGDLEALPDYLWGIETSESSKLDGRLQRFQTTYEELKQRLMIGPSISITASRLPMRNWNMRSQPKSGYRSCFQTTYEELKPNQLQDSS